MTNYTEQNAETIHGYTVHSFYIDGPERGKRSACKEALTRIQKSTVLRYFAFAALAPLAMLADAVVSMFS